MSKQLRQTPPEIDHESTMKTHIHDGTDTRLSSSAQHLPLPPQCTASVAQSPKSVKAVLVVAGTSSGVGKTTAACGLMAAFARRGLTVQPFKCGPDFLDGMHHEAAVSAGRAGSCVFNRDDGTRNRNNTIEETSPAPVPRKSVNLDGWMMGGRDAVQFSFLRHSFGADVCVVEGAMGLHDGRDGLSDEGSTAEIAKILGAPVVLVVDASAMARSVAAIVLGYATFDPDLRLGGVIVNKIGGAAHVAWIEEALAQDCGRRLKDVGTDLPIVFAGGLPTDKRASVPERHLGLVMPSEIKTVSSELGANNLADRYLRLAALVEANLNVDALLDLGRTCRQMETCQLSRNVHSLYCTSSRCRIGVAQDQAFCFYYADNLHLLRNAGGELVPFSPLTSGCIPPDLDALYIGGGYPELHAAELERNASLRHDIRNFAKAGGFIFAECGGLLYLSSALWTAAGSSAGGGGSIAGKHKYRRYRMCGVLPNVIGRMTPHMKMYYAKVEFAANENNIFPRGWTCRGHKFHFSDTIDVVKKDRGHERADFGDENDPYAGGSMGEDEDEGELYGPTPFLVTPQTPGASAEPDGYSIRNVVASYLHLHFASCPHDLAQSFVSTAVRLSPRRLAHAASFVSAATEIVFALGAEEFLGGVTSLCDYPSHARLAPRSVLCRSPIDASKMTSLEVTAAVEEMRLRKKREDCKRARGGGAGGLPGHWIIDRASLLNLSPRIAFVQKTCDICDPSQDDVLFALEDTGLISAGCEVVPVSPTSLEGMFDSIRAVSNALGVTEKGEQLCTSLRRRLRRIKDALSRLLNATESVDAIRHKTPRVLSLEGLAPLCTGGNWLPDVKLAAGCEDALGDVGGCNSRLLSWREIAEADPDVLIISPCSAAPSRTLNELHLLASSETFRKLRCVQKGEVYVLDHAFFSRPGPRLVQGVEMLATLLRGVPPPENVMESDLWEGYAYKYHCSTEQGGHLSHCTTELSVRFEPCFVKGSRVDEKVDEGDPWNSPENDITEERMHGKMEKLHSSLTKNTINRISVTRCTVSCCALPRDRSAHCLVAFFGSRDRPQDRQSVLLLGGDDEYGCRLSEAWVLRPPFLGWSSDLDQFDEGGLKHPRLGASPTWERMECGVVVGEENEVPTARSNAAAVRCGTDHVLVFGGWGADGLTPLANGELLHLKTFCWTHCSTRREEHPAPRGNPTLVYSSAEHIAILFGGWNGVQRFNDLWILDMESWEWNRIEKSCYGPKQETTAACWPRARTDHTAVLWERSSSEDVMIVFGGSIDGGGTSSELWTLRSRRRAGWMWMEWSIDGPTPSPRTSHAAAVVGTGNSAKMIVVGGTDSSRGCGRGALLCDAWVLAPLGGSGPDGAPSWLKLEWAGAVVERCRHAMVPVGDSAVLVWGGYQGESVVRDDSSCWLGTVSNEEKDERAIGPSGKNGSSGCKQERSQLQERWEAEVPVRESDLPLEELAKARQSKLPGALYKAIHRYAVANNRDTYIDPDSGYSVFTQVYLKRRTCCGNGCRHCPHGHVNVPRRKTASKAGTFDVPGDLNW